MENHVWLFDKPEVRSYISWSTGGIHEGSGHVGWCCLVDTSTPSSAPRFRLTKIFEREYHKLYAHEDLYCHESNPRTEVEVTAIGFAIRQIVKQYARAPEARNGPRKVRAIKTPEVKLVLGVSDLNVVLMLRPLRRCYPMMSYNKRRLDRLA